MIAFIVEDYEPMRMILKRILKKNFPEIKTIVESATAEDALVRIPEIKPAIALIDISLPEMDGLELIGKLKQKCKGVCILVVTAHEVEFYKEKALQVGAHDIASKSDFDGLITVVKSLLGRRETGECG